MLTVAYQVVPMMGDELATPQLQTECSSHWAIQVVFAKACR